MKNTGKQEPPVFIISSQKDMSIALLCLNMYKGIMEKKDAPFNRLEGEYQDSLLKLMERVFSKIKLKEEADDTDEEDEAFENMVEGDEISMNYVESFGMMHSIVQTFYALKRHLDLPAEKKALWEPEFMEEVEILFNDNKDNAAELLWRLTEELFYTDYGLQCLEEVFDLKLAVRPLKVDKTKEISTLTINHDNIHLFSWTFSQLNYLEYCKDIYDFARRMYSCQFFYIEDYKYISKRLKDCKEGDKFSFTMYDTLCLYYSVSLCGLLFASDAADMLDEMDKKMKNEKNELTITLYQVRNFFLKFSVTFLKDIKKKLSKNDEFLKHIAVIDKWKL
jgi:hypothetical protein